MTNRGWILEYVNCQPGKQVYKNTIIAKIRPNQDDMTYQNSTIQLSALKEQLDNLTRIYGYTQHTFVLQKDILQNQYANNTLLLSNLQKTAWYTDASISYQQDLLDQQYDTLQTSKSTDLDKMKTSISNAYKQYLIMIKDALKKVNDAFTATAYTVWDKDPSSKQSVLSQYSVLNAKVSDTMSASQFSQYLLDLSDFMALAAKSITATTPSSVLPQSSAYGLSIDGLYTTYTTLASTFMTSKSAFDTLSSSYDSVKNTYASQIKALDTNRDNYNENTAASTSLQIENQEANLQLAQKTISNQLDSAEENQNTQLTSLKNQIITMQQNVAVLSNSMGGEILYAGIDGVVKMRALGEDNKVAPNTLLCQILPTSPGNLSLQVFSYTQLHIGSRVGISDDQGTFLSTWILVYEYPYKDPVTQNYIYEIPVIHGSLKENQRVLITLSQSPDTDQIWIPLHYISPRIEGNVVRKKVGSWVQDIYVQLWDIDDQYVRILSWLNIGDEIVN